VLGDLFLLREREAVQERVHRGLAIAPPPLGRSLRVVLVHQLIEVTLEIIQRRIEKLAKGHPRELVEERLVEPLTDTIRPRPLRLRARVVDVLHGQRELVRMAVRPATLLGAAIRQDAAQREAVVREERHDAIVEPIGGGDRRLLRVELRQADLGVGVDEVCWSMRPTPFSVPTYNVSCAPQYPGHSRSNSPGLPFPAAHARAPLIAPR